MKASIYNQTGKGVGTISLPEDVFGLPWNGDLVHQVVMSMRSNARTPVAHAKDRSEVSGGGKKPWQQKGTGRARHGSIRSPLWAGGGATHGPRKEKSYKKNINKKMRAKALYTVLSEKLRSGEVMFVNKLDVGDIKTKKAKEIISALSGISGFEGLATKKRNAVYIAVLGKDENVKKSFRNFSNMRLEDVERMNPSRILNYKYLIISSPDESIKYIAGKLKK
ncbi:MAG: 50S ribosomal protein L4 [Patescibacteria group bacterium]|nr:MAG: 50S ribosomal protein L4 [Patescibacteria group bacterium]